MPPCYKKPHGRKRTSHEVLSAVAHVDWLTWYCGYTLSDALKFVELDRTTYSKNYFVPPHDGRLRPYR